MESLFLVQDRPVFVSEGLVTITCNGQNKLTQKELDWYIQYLVTEGFMKEPTRTLVRIVNDRQYKRYLNTARRK